MYKYCEKCGKEVEVYIVHKVEGYDVCGETIDVDTFRATCTECSEELSSDELYLLARLNAYNMYRKEHKLLLPEEIKEIREQYGMSQRGFARLLNWGDKTIWRYENGSIPDKVHNSLLLLLREPENMIRYINDNEIMINEKQKGKLLKTIEGIRVEKTVENYLIRAAIDSRYDLNLWFRYLRKEFKDGSLMTDSSIIEEVKRSNKVTDVQKQCLERAMVENSDTQQYIISLNSPATASMLDQIRRKYCGQGI